MKQTNWTKKATILLAAVCVALAVLCGIAKPLDEQWLVQVEGVPVQRGLYSYFLSQALESAPRNNQGLPKDMTALRADVLQRCKAYVAVNSELRNMGRVLSQSSKMLTAERTAGLWRVFGNYYTSIGVDKPTLGKAVRGQAAREQLFRALYDTGGTMSVPEESIQSYFYGNFVAYDGIRVFLTVTQEDGQERDMTAAEKDALRATLKTFVEKANAAATQEEGTFDFLGMAQEEPYAAAFGYALPSVTVVRKDAGDMPEVVFESVRGMDPNKLTLVEVPKFFLVARGVNMRESPEEFYNGYRSKCLQALKGEAFETQAAKLTEAFQADENTEAIEKLMAGWKF
jgi:hypothetical protein